MAISLATLAIASVFGSMILSLKETEVDVINKILKSNLCIKVGNKEVYPYIYSTQSEKYFVELPKGFEFSQLEKLKGKIENAIKKNILISNDNFTYSIKIIENSEAPTLAPFQLVDTESEKGIKLGIGEGKNGIIYLDFNKAPHTLVGGSTGWGKSIFIKNLIVQLIENYPDVELELFDFKAGIELKDFENIKQIKSFVVKPHLAGSELERIYEEIESRFDLITNADCRDIFEFNSKTNNKLQYKFVILEEFTILLDIQKDISNILVKSLAISRATGIFFLFSSQRFDSKIIDSKIKANIDNRICFRTADGINSKLILDQTGAENLKNVGRGFISNGGELQEFQSFYVTKKDIESVTKKYFEAKNSEKPLKINKDNENKGGNNLWA